MLEWLEGLDMPLKSIWKLKRFNVGGRRHPLYLAFQRRRFDLVDAFFALGASLQDRPSGQRSVLQIIFSELDRNEIWRLIERGVAIRPVDVISMDDVVSIVLNWNHQRSLKIPEDVEPEMFSADYRVLVGWTKPRQSQRLLRWKRPFYESNTKLWANIFKASTSQERRVHAGLAVRHQNLVLHAALQSNWAAVRCLLDMGFSPDGAGAYWYSTAHHLYQLPLKPLDVASWTARVPDRVCTGSGLKLKRSNEAIAALLRERAGTQSGAYSVSNLFALPFLETWEYLCAEINEVTHHHSRIGLFFSMAGFLVGIFSLWLLWYLAGMVSGFTSVGFVLYLLFYAIAVPNLLLLIWAMLWLPMKVVVKGHRKTAYARLVHGDSLIAFWTAAIGQGNAVYWLLGRILSGWRESSLDDGERSGGEGGEFGRRLVNEYEAIIRTPIDRKEIGEAEGDGDSVPALRLFIRGNTFKFTTGSRDFTSCGPSGSTRPGVQFEMGDSSPENEATPLLAAQSRSIIGQGLRKAHTTGQGRPRTEPEFDESPRPGLRVVTSWHSQEGGYGTPVPELGPHAGSFDSGGFEPRSMDPGDAAIMQDTPAWSGHEWQWRMFLMNSNLQSK